jgi:hypothetical protein
VHYARRLNSCLPIRFITEANRILSVLFGIHNKALVPY